MGGDVIGVGECAGPHLRNKSSCDFGTTASSGTVMWALSIIPATSCMVLTAHPSRLQAQRRAVGNRCDLEMLAVCCT